MVARAQLGQISALFRRTQDEITLTKVVSRIETVQRKNSNKICAKQAFLAGLIRLVHQRRRAGHDQHIRGDVTQHLVSSHGAQWDQLPLPLKAGWHDRALSLREDAKRKIDEELRENFKRKKTLEQAVLQSQEDGPFSLSRRRLTTAELKEFDKMWFKPLYSVSKIAEAFGASMQPLLPLGSAELALLATYHGPPLATGTSPAWAACVCRNRGHFEDSVLRVTYKEDSVVCYLLFLSGLKNPLVCSFLDLELTSADALPAGVADHAVGHAETLVYLKVNPMGYSFSTDDEYDAIAKVQVLRPVRLVDKGILASSAAWVDFEDFVAALPEPAAPPAPKKPRMPPASSVDAHVLQEFPWLLDVLRASKQPKATAMQEEHENSEEQGSAKASDSECEEQSDILDDGEDSEAHFDLDEVVARLEEKREIEALDFEGGDQI